MQTSCEAIEWNAENHSIACPHPPTAPLNYLSSCTTCFLYISLYIALLTRVCLAGSSTREILAAQITTKMWKMHEMNIKAFEAVSVALNVWYPLVGNVVANRHTIRTVVALKIHSWWVRFRHIVIRVLRLCSKRKQQIQLIWQCLVCVFYLI